MNTCATCQWAKPYEAPVGPEPQPTQHSILWGLFKWQKEPSYFNNTEWYDRELDSRLYTRCRLNPKQLRVKKDYHCSHHKDRIAE